MTFSISRLFAPKEKFEILKGTSDTEHFSTLAMVAIMCTGGIWKSSVEMRADSCIFDKVVTPILYAENSRIKIVNNSDEHYSDKIDMEKCHGGESLWAREMHLSDCTDMTEVRASQKLLLHQCERIDTVFSKQVIEMTNCMDIKKVIAASITLLECNDIHVVSGDNVEAFDSVEIKQLSGSKVLVQGSEKVISTICGDMIVSKELQLGNAFVTGTVQFLGERIVLRNSHITKLSIEPLSLEAHAVCRQIILVNSTIKECVQTGDDLLDIREEGTTYFPVIQKNGLLRVETRSITPECV